MRVIARRLTFAALGFGSIFGAIFYFAAVVSISADVNWSQVLTFALAMAPLGLFAGTYPE